MCLSNINDGRGVKLRYYYRTFLIIKVRRRSDVSCYKFTLTAGRTKLDERLTHYAVKHAVYHLTDAGKQAENVARVLCSLHYVQHKLKLNPEISGRIALGYLLNDYEHSHYQVSRQHSNEF